MEIALFFSGSKTLLGVKYNNGKIENRVIDPFLLFNDPLTFVDRFILTLKNCFDIQNPKEINRIYFGIQGIINEKSGKVINCEALDQLTMAKSYSGFSFKENFGKIIGEENVFVFNDTLAVSMGVGDFMPKNKSTIVYLIDKETSVSYINQIGGVKLIELGNLKLPKELADSSIAQLAGPSIHEILFSGDKDVFGTYTTNFIGSVQVLFRSVDILIEVFAKLIDPWVPLFNLSKKLLDKFTSASKKTTDNRVFVWSVYEEYINKNQLKDSGLGEIISFPKDENQKNLIPILGCFAYPKQLKLTSQTIKRIEYISNSKSVYQFTEYSDFETHWNTNHTFASPKNEYHIFYSDDSVKIRKMADIKEKKDLEEFIF